MSLPAGVTWYFPLMVWILVFFKLNGLRNSKIVLVQNSWNCCLYLFVYCFFNWRLLVDNFYFPSWPIYLSGVLFFRRIRRVCKGSEREKKKTLFSSFPTSTPLHLPSINAPWFTPYRILFAPQQKPYQIGLLFTHKSCDFCDGAKLRRADLDSEASQIV